MDRQTEDITGLPVEKKGENGCSSDCDCVSPKRGGGVDDLGSGNSATASISFSSSSSLTSSYDNNGISSSISTSSDSHHDNEFNGKNLWWIHGKGYDLMDFVNSHPGGVEAILLGKGRDCTALVESYHAFSGDRVWKTLEKYRSRTDLPDYEDEEETDESQTSKGTIHPTTDQDGRREKDFFYEILKKRVTKILLSKGIDPVKDRGASHQRIAYYIVVLVLWLYTGFLHCTVSFPIVPTIHATRLSKLKSTRTTQLCLLLSSVSFRIETNEPKNCA